MPSILCSRAVAVAAAVALATQIRTWIDVIEYQRNSIPPAVHLAPEDPQ
jgi:hypothetical protein